MKKYIGILISVLLLASCKTTVPPTQIEVYKPVRHYPPVIMGSNLRVGYKMHNRGDHPFVFKEILPDNTSITLAANSPTILPPKDSLTLYFIFNTARNVGLTTHHIRVYGNVLNPDDSTGVYSPGLITLTFDVPIVRHSPDGADYEEYYFAQKPDYEFLVDGTIEEIASNSFD